MVARTVASRKAKGRNLQKEIAEAISYILDEECGKDCPIQSREMGQSGVDIKLEKWLLKEFPFSIEVKAQDRWSVPAWIKQAEDNELENTNWLLFFQRKNKNPVAVIDAYVLFEILRKVYGRNKEKKKAKLKRAKKTA